MVATAAQAPAGSSSSGGGGSTSFVVNERQQASAILGCRWVERSTCRAPAPTHLPPPPSWPVQHQWGTSTAPPRAPPGAAGHICTPPSLPTRLQTSTRAPSPPAAAKAKPEKTLVGGGTGGRASGGRRACVRAAVRRHSGSGARAAVVGAAQTPARCPGLPAREASPGCTRGPHVPAHTPNPP